MLPYALCWLGLITLVGPEGVSNRSGTADAIQVVAGSRDDTMDPREGVTVREIRLGGLRHVSADLVTRHLSTRVGLPFHRAALAVDRRRLDELRLFSGVDLSAELDGGAVVVTVTVTETLRLLPVIAVRVTDENGLSVGGGARALNLAGRGTQSGVSLLFGGETSVGASIDATTVTPGTWARHVAFSYSSRQNTVFDFHEQDTSVEGRFGRNLPHDVRAGVYGSLLAADTGSSGASLSADGEDVIATVGGFLTLDTLDSSTNPRKGTWAEIEIDRLAGNAHSWTVTLDARRFQPLSARHGLAGFSLATFQTGTVNETLPEYLQFSLGGANSVRGWPLGSRVGRNQFIGSAEYVFIAQPVTPFSVLGLNAYVGVQVVVFGDVGWAWDSSASRQSAIDGYGVGLRFVVPFVDLLRVDVAWGDPMHGAVAYFGISLKATKQRDRVR